MPIGILIAEAHIVLREALRALLEAEPDLKIVGHADSAKEVPRHATALCPDVVLLDISLPDLQSLETLRQWSHALRDTQFLLLLGAGDPVLIRDALLAGAAGCVIKRDADTTLVAAVRAVVQGQMYIPAELSPGSDACPPKLQGSSGEIAAILTPCELDVLCLVAQGRTNHQIACKLGLDALEVASRRAILMAKLGLHSRVELVRYAALRHLSEAPRDPA